MMNGFFTKSRSSPNCTLQLTALIMYHNPDHPLGVWRGCLSKHQDPNWRGILRLWGCIIILKGFGALTVRASIRDLRRNKTRSTPECQTKLLLPRPQTSGRVSTSPKGKCSGASPSIGPPKHREWAVLREVPIAVREVDDGDASSAQRDSLSPEGFLGKQK